MIEWIAFGFAVAGLLSYGLVFFFGDLFLKTDDQLRRTMDLVLWCLVLGLALSTFAALR